MWLSGEIVQGGWTLVVIGLCSVVAAGVILERIYALRRARVIAPEVARALDAYNDGDSVAAVLSVCNKNRGAFARIAAAIVEMRRLEHAQAIERMRAVGRVELEKLERGLTVLEIIAAATPLLGLLGTVLGMMDVFSVITTEGIGDPQVLAGGISKALITTVAGLSVAIPSLAFHSLFARRVGALGAEMQDLATAFLLRAQHADGDITRE
ncbi:MAG TPA: MotA/TolQ/ExbB proton channel family protein [Candidatus Hydrogenedentes bacterium]|nr:MotA/TolQ/ExbB proton channel family protein [Candidatus Hydrogenedentota bacterium]